MSRKKFTLQIDEPCSQNWNEMTPDENGRFCSHCTKVVKDFTIMTENQIIEFFKNFSGEVCGRFYNRQLEHSYALSIRKSPWYANRFFQFAISGLLTLSLTDTVANAPKNQIEQKSKADDENDVIAFQDKEKGDRTIEGKVVDEYGDSPLTNATVRIEETEQTFTTDSTGKFKFELPENFKGKKFTIIVSHSRHEAQVRTINVDQLPMKDLIVRMEYENIKMGKVHYQRD